MDDAQDENEAIERLVVIGSSAGGVEALLILVASLPEDFPAPIVVAQHLDPYRPSNLASLLANRAQIPVITVTNEEALRPGTIYVVPIDRDVEITDHHVSVVRRNGPTPKPSVDRLLATAARVFGDRLLAVILTGSGSDGADGAQAVKAYGGTVVVQNPETARFPGMPSSVALSSVDIVANLEAIGPLLIDLLSGEYVLPADEDELRRFLESVRERTGLDFGAYKRPTILRRLQGRMAALDLDSLVEYRRYIDRHPEELQRLVSAFLIKFTRFFRDPELFDHLRDHVLPDLIADARQRGELRIWSAGCATGEEAYSIAMLVADLLADDPDPMPVRIFATDVAPDAVDFARRGVYPVAALADVPAEMIGRHFVRFDGGYEVRKAVRAMLVFGEHDLAHRAPFPRTDLVLCRNVLIYFTGGLQRRALELFAFSLRRGGRLILGKSETVSPLPEFFALEHPRLKVFHRVGPAMPIAADQIPDVTQLNSAGLRPAPRRSPQPFPGRTSPPVLRSLETPPAQRADVILNELATGIVTVDARYDVLTINAAARRLLGIQTSGIGEDLIHGVAPSLAIELRAAIDSALTGQARNFAHRLPPDPIDGEESDLSIAVLPLLTDEPDAAIEAVLIEVVDCTEGSRRERELASELEGLRAEHAAVQERSVSAISEAQHLRTINQAMAKEQGRLRADVELLQVAHEEAQAAAEEIETLHEEQQATNEEMETVNEELQATVEELQATIGELQATNEEMLRRSAELEAVAASREAERARLAAIVGNMADAILVVDAEGNSMLTNTAYERLFPEDTEVVLDSSGHPLPVNDLPSRRAARGESFSMTFLLEGNGGKRRRYEATGQPIIGGDGAGAGVVVIRELGEEASAMVESKQASE
jgi:two-component system CheB/CheR fusion protein